MCLIASLALILEENLIKFTTNKHQGGFTGEAIKGSENFNFI